MVKVFFLSVLAGNMFLAPCRGATVTWVGGSGDRGDASKWSGGATPGQNDDAVIDTSKGAITVTVSSETVQVNSLSCEETLLLNGGTILGGTVSTDNGGVLVVQSGTVDGVTVNGVLDLGNTYDWASLTVTNGLVLNGEAMVGADRGTVGAINFAGSQVLGGTGTVVFGYYFDPSLNVLRPTQSGTTLVIGAGITVRGGSGTIGAPSASVVNQGAISPDVKNGTIVVTGQSVSNQGSVQMSHGGSLVINNLPDAAGLSASDGGTLTLGGTWQNTGVLTATAGSTLNCGGSWTNAGSLEAVNATVNLSGNWTNVGTFNMVGATLSLSGSWGDAGMLDATNTTVNLGGGLTPAMLGQVSLSGATVWLTGTLTNQGSTLVSDGATASWGLNGGRVLGGIITTTNGASFAVQSGTLDGVTVNGVLDVGNSYSSGAHLTVLDGLVLNGLAQVGNPTNASESSYGVISFSGSQVLSGVGTVVFGNAWEGWGGFNPMNAVVLANPGTTLVIGPEITVRGQNGQVGYSTVLGGPQDVSVANQGTIAPDVSGGTIVVAGTSFSNGGQLLKSAAGGSITVTAGTVNTGLVEADHGAITLSGGFTQNGGTMAFGLTSPTDFGQINLSGPALGNLSGVASVGGTLSAQLDSGYVPNPGDSFALLNYGTNSVAFTNVVFPAGIAWQTNYSQGVLTQVAKGILPLGVTISPSNQTVAAGSTVTFQATASGPGPFGYQWFWNGVALTGATNASLVLSNVTSVASGAYTVQLRIDPRRHILPHLRGDQQLFHVSYPGAATTATWTSSGPQLTTP
jgi:hypothetical protein